MLVVFAVFNFMCFIVEFQQPQGKKSVIIFNQVWWLILIIPATQVTETGGLRLKASPGKKSARACLRTKLNNLQLF
jgi:hypothetical protein